MPYYSPTYAYMRSSPYTPDPANWLSYNPLRQRNLRATPLVAGHKYRCVTRTPQNSNTLKIANRLKDFESHIEDSYHRQRIDIIRNRNRPVSHLPATSDIPIADGTSIHTGNMATKLMKSKSNGENNYKPVDTAVPYLSFGLDIGFNGISPSATPNIGTKEKNATSTAVSKRNLATSSSSQGAKLVGPFTKQVSKKGQQSKALKSSSKSSCQPPPEPTLISRHTTELQVLQKVTAPKHSLQGIVPLSPQRYLMCRPTSNSSKQQPRVTVSQLKANLIRGGTLHSSSHSQMGGGPTQTPTQGQLLTSGTSAGRKTQPKRIQLSTSGRLRICTADSFNEMSTPKITYPSMRSFAADNVFNSNYSNPRGRSSLPVVSQPKVPMGIRIHDPYAPSPLPLPIPTPQPASITASNSAVSLLDWENDPHPSVNDFKENALPQISEFVYTNYIESSQYDTEHVNKKTKLIEAHSSATNPHSTEYETTVKAASKSASKLKSQARKNNLKAKLKNLLKIQRPVSSIDTDSRRCRIYNNNTPHCPVNPRKVTSNPSLQRAQAILRNMEKSHHSSSTKNDKDKVKDQGKHVKRPNNKLKTNGRCERSGTATPIDSCTKDLNCYSSTIRRDGKMDHQLNESDNGLKLSLRPASEIPSAVPSRVKLKGILKSSKNRPSVRIIKDANNNNASNGYSALADLGVCTAQPGTEEWTKYWEKYDVALSAYKQSEAIFLRDNLEYQPDIEKYTKEAARLAFEEAIFRQSIGLDPKAVHDVIQKPVLGLTTLNGFVFDRNANGPVALLSSSGPKGFRLEIDVRGHDPDKIDIETEFNLMKVHIPMSVGGTHFIKKSIVIGVPHDFNLGELEIYPIVNGWLVVEAPDKKRDELLIAC